MDLDFDSGGNVRLQEVISVLSMEGLIIIHVLQEIEPSLDPTLPKIPLLPYEHCMVNSVEVIFARVEHHIV